MVRGLGFFYAATLVKEVTEWLKVTVSKTVERKFRAGSNPAFLGQCRGWRAITGV